MSFITNIFEFPENPSLLGKCPLDMEIDDFMDSVGE